MCEDCEEKEKIPENVEATSLAEANHYIKIARRSQGELRLAYDSLEKEHVVLLSQEHKRDLWVGIAVLLLLSAYLILVWEVL